MRARRVAGRMKDVFFDPARKVLDLRNSPAFQQASDVVFPPGSFRHKHRRIILVSFFILALATSLSFTKQGSASVTTFYPSSCVGGWKNVGQAGGVPSLGDADPASYFTSENAAQYVDGTDITCSSFTGQVPASSAVPQKLTVTFRWSLDDGSVSHEPSVQTPVKEIPSGAPDVKKEETPTESEKPVEVIRVPSDATIPEETPAPDVASTPEPTPAASEVAPTSVDETPAPSEQQASLRSALSQSLANVFSAGDDTANAFLEARYSFDGETWKSLGKVSATNWQTVSFSIDGGEIADWTDMSKLQVGLFSVGDTKAPVVFLDSVALDAQYEDATALNTVPTVEVTDPSISIVTSTKPDFNLNESPTFHVVDPNLTAQNISDLVRGNKATVLKDDMGVLDDAVRAQDVVASGATDALATDSSLSASVFAASALTVPTFGGSDLLSALEDGHTFFGKLISFMVPFSKYMLAFVGANPPPVIDAVVLDGVGDQTPIAASVQRVVVDGVEQDQVVIAKPERMFRPGKYTLQVTLHTSEALVVAKQDFTWGVLAVNMDKSIYAPGDTAYVQMGVINDLGHTICNADMTMTITAPSGETDTFTTAHGSIIRDSQCGPDNVISVPDYYVHYAKTGEEGLYTIVLSATTDNGTREVYDSFTVQKNAAFDVRRTGPTRIYPVASYPVSMHIVPSADWSGTVTERVPANFDITPAVHSISYDSMETDGESIILSWKLSLKKGEETTIGYYFTGPRISPEFYLLGPLSFYDDGVDTHSGTPSFAESRQWQIADDAVCTATIGGTWNTTNTGSMWTGCTGTNGTPGTADDVTINPGVSITLGINTPVVNSLTINGTLNTSVSNSALNTKSLSVPSGGILTANGSTITVSGTTNSILSIVGTFNKGTSTMLLTGGSTATTIPAVAYYNLTLNNALNTYVLTGPTSVDPLGTFNELAGAFSTTASNYPLSAGKINIGNVTSAIFSANGSTITLTATSGTLFTRGATGAFNAGTSTVVVSQDAALTPFSAQTVTFNNMTFAPVLTTSRTYTFPAATLTFTGNLSVTPSGIGTLSIAIPNALSIAASGTFIAQPSGSALVSMSGAGAVTAGTLDIEANATYAPTSGTAVTLSGTTGTPLIVNGTYTAGTSVITFSGDNPAGNTTIPSNVSYYSVTLNNATETYVLNGNTTLSSLGTLTVTLGTFSTTASNYSLSVGKITLAASASAIFSANASTITMTGTTSTVFAKNAASIFNAGTSTFIFNGDASATLFFTTPSTFYNLVFSPTLTTNRTYTLGAALTINGNFSITPSGTGALAVAFTSGQTSVTATSTSTVLLQPSGLATVTLDTVSATGSITTGILDIETGAAMTLSAASAVTLTGATAMPLIVNGSLSTGTSTITFSGNNASGNTTIPSNVTYYSLAVNNASETYVLSGTTNLSSAGTLTVTAGTFDTTASNYALSTGKIVIANTATAILNANASTITVTATSGTLFSKNGSGVFNAGTSTVVLSGDGSVQFLNAAVTFYNLTINPVLTTSRVYTIGGVALTTNGDFTINPSGTGTLSFPFSAGTTSITVAATKTFTLSGTGGATSSMDTSGSGNAVSFGTLDIEAAGTFTANQSVITLTGTNGTPFIMNGTFNQGTSNVTYTGNNASGNTTIATNLTYYSLTVNNSAETYVLGGALTGLAGGTLAVTNGTFDTTSSNYAVTIGHVSATNGVATAIFLGNASTLTLTGTTGTLFARNNSAVVTITNTDIVMNGDGSPTMFTSAGTYTFRSLTLSPVITATRAYIFNTPVMTLSGNFLVSPSAASAAAFSMTMSNVGFTVGAAGTFSIAPSGSATATIDTSISNAALSVGALDIESGGTLTANGSTITITGTSLTPFIQNGTFNPGTGTITFTGTSTGAALPATSFYNVTINKTGSMLLTGTTTIAVGATLSIQSGTLDTTSNNYALSAGHILMGGASSICIANASTITLTGISGTLFSKANASTFTQGTSEVIVTSASGTPSLLVSAGNTLLFHKLTIDSTATVINTVGSLIMSNAVAGNRLYIKRGVLNDSGVQIVGTTNGTLQMDAGAALCIGEVSATVATCNNSTSAAATLFPTNYTNANILLDPASTVNYVGNASMTISNVPTYGNLTFAPLLSSSRTYTFTGATTINGNFSITPATGASGAFTVTAMLGGATTVAVGKTTLLQGGGANSVVGTLDTKSGSNYAFSTGSLDIEALGTVLARAATITIGNNWTNNGTFTQATSTVLFNTANTSVISGTTTFYNLSIIPGGVDKEVDFATSGAPIFTVSNVFTATGTSGHLVKLYSDTPGTQWEFLPSSTTSASYVDVKDGGCHPGASITSPTFSTNSGNNDFCWSFVPFVQFSISDNTIGFGPLSSIAARYATPDALGSYAETEAHQISVATSAPGGYSLFVKGSNLSKGGDSITPIGNVNTSSIPGTEQFGLRCVATGGSGVVQSPYNGSGFAYAATSSTASMIAQQTTADPTQTTYSLRYIANITGATDAGSYATNLTYILTPNF